MLTAPGERRPVTPSIREARSAALHQRLQAADTLYPEEVLKGGFNEGNLPLRVLEALDSIMLETGKASASAGQIAGRINELYLSRQASEQMDSQRLKRTIEDLRQKGYLKSRRILGSSRGKLAATVNIFYNRPKDQQPTVATSR